MLEKLHYTLRAKGYKLFMRPYELNIAGLRSPNRSANLFDDWLFVFYLTDEGTWKLHRFAATTDPGTPWLKQPINPLGAAILKPGQYAGAYALGLHRGKYKALVQQKPVTVYRDANRDNILNCTGVKTETGLFGINIHRASDKGISKTVEKHSAGCQVFQDAEDFDLFISLCEEHGKRYGNSFSYTLLEELMSADDRVNLVMKRCHSTATAENA